MGKYPGSRGTEIPGRDLGYVPQVSIIILYGQYGSIYIYIYIYIYISVPLV